MKQDRAITAIGLLTAFMGLLMLSVGRFILGGIVLLLAFGVSTSIALLSNLLTKKRRKKTFEFWKKDLDPIEVKIEAFGMGRMAAEVGEESNIQIPYDILAELAKTYNTDTEELMGPFVKGLTTERKEREKRAERGALKQVGTVRLNKKGEKR